MSFISTMCIAGTAISMIGNGNVESNTGNMANQLCNNQNIIVQQQNIGNGQELKDILNKKGICIENNEIGNPDNGETSDSSYAAQVVNLVNIEREKAGLKPLVSDQKTADAALVRAKEIKQSFSHTRPDGKSFSTVLNEHGVSYDSSGENIAWGQSTPEEVVSGWMNSEGHRANILNNNFTSIGVGHYETNGTSYWVQLFTS